jgi:hypothetical protein
VRIYGRILSDAIYIGGYNQDVFVEGYFMRYMIYIYICTAYMHMSYVYIYIHIHDIYIYIYMIYIYMYVYVYDMMRYDLI